jgi:hypothetical protein
MRPLGKARDRVDPVLVSLHQRIGIDLGYVHAVQIDSRDSRAGPTRRTDKRIRRCVFTRMSELVSALNEYFAADNAKPKPFIGTAKASDFLAKVTRACAALK